MKYNRDFPNKPVDGIYIFDLNNTNKLISKLKIMKAVNVGNQEHVSLKSINQIYAI